MRSLVQMVNGLDAIWPRISGMTTRGVNSSIPDGTVNTEGRVGCAAVVRGIAVRLVVGETSVVSGIPCGDKRWIGDRSPEEARSERKVIPGVDVREEASEDSLEHVCLERLFLEILPNAGVLVVKFADPCILFDVKETVRVKSRKLVTTEAEGLFIFANFFGH